MTRTGVVGSHSLWPRCVRILQLLIPPGFVGYFHAERMGREVRIENMKPEKINFTAHFHPLIFKPPRLPSLLSRSNRSIHSCLYHRRIFRSLSFPMIPQSPV